MVGYIFIYNGEFIKRSIKGGKKMNRKISLVGIISAIAFLAVLVLVPMRAEAATTKTFTDGKTVALKKEGTVYYKYVLNDDALVEINYAYNNAGRVGVAIYSDKNMSKFVASFYPSDVSGKQFYALQKGTYYINMYEGSQYWSGTPTAKVKIASTPASSINKDNYCRKKAQTITAKKWVKVVQSPNYDYDRYYLIKLTKTQKINIDVPAGDTYDFRIYEGKTLNSVSLSRGKQTITSENKYAAGTYILVISSGSFNTYRTGYFYQFKWY